MNNHHFVASVDSGAALAPTLNTIALYFIFPNSLSRILGISILLSADLRDTILLNLSSPMLLSPIPLGPEMPPAPPPPSDMFAFLITSSLRLARLNFPETSFGGYCSFTRWLK